MTESSDAGAMDLGDDADRSYFTQKQIPNSTNQSTPRESSQMRDLPYPSRSAVQLPPANINGADHSGNVSMGDVSESGAPAQPRRRSPLMIEKLKLKGILMGYYKLSDVEAVEDKHAVYGKIDKGGDLFTTVSKETRSGAPVPSQQYLASKVQCSPDKICFEPHLVGLNKLQLKQYVQARLAANWSLEDDHSRKISELQIADAARNDRSLVGPGASEHKKQPAVITTTNKRDYSAFAEDNEDDDEEDEESPLSEVNETTFRDTDDEDAFVPAGGVKKRKSGRKSIGARTAKGDSKETDGDEIGDGVLVGVWKGSLAELNDDKHAVYSYLDSRDSLWSRVFHATKDGRHIDMDIPFPRGTVKWDDIILDDHLVQMNRDDAKEYVRQQRQVMTSTPNDDLLKKDRKPRKSNGSAEQMIKQEPSALFKSKTSAILLGYWAKALHPDPAMKNAVFGYVDTSGRFNLQVRKHTRDGRELNDNNPDFPGNGRVQKDHMVSEDHIKHLTHPEVQAYTRRALAEGLPELSGQELKDAEIRIADEIVRERGSEIGQEKALEEGPRIKRKYTKRATIQPIHSMESLEDSMVDEVSMARPLSRQNSQMSGGGAAFDPSASMGGLPASMANAQGQGFLQAQQPAQQAYGYQHQDVLQVSRGPNGSYLINGTAYYPQHPVQAPVIDETGTIITNNGTQYTQKSTGAFKGKFVGAQKEVISINGDDYAEYRVLVPMEL